MRVEVKTPKTPKTPKKSHRNHLKKRWQHILLVALVVAAFGFMVVAYIRTDAKLKQLESRTEQSTQQEVDSLIDAVGKHMRLPDEKPTIATVEDESKLKDQSFFRYAEKGDKVLMYTESKKAILYRPSTDKIIEIAYLNINR